MFVFRESLLECSFCQSDVVLRGIVCCDLGVVDYTSMLNGLSSAEQDRTATSRRDLTFARQKN